MWRRLSVWLENLAMTKNMDLDDLTLITSETKATYPKIKEYLLKKFRFKVSGLYIMQIKAKYVL